MSGGRASPPRALSIAGSDSGGGAGIQADLRAFAAFGVHGCTAITAVTAQNSVGVHSVAELDPWMVVDQIEAVVNDIGVGAVKIGMLSSPAVAAAVAQCLRTLRTGPVVVDPVAVSKHGDPLLRRDAVRVLVEQVLPLADLVTPNLGEVELLTGLAVRDRADQVAAARRVHELGPRWVLVKGGHLPGEQDAVDVLFDGEQVVELTAPRQRTRHTHGTGCTLSAAIAASLATGRDMPTAVREGKDHVSAAIRNGYPLGRGIGPVGPVSPVVDVRAVEVPAR